MNIEKSVWGKSELPQSASRPGGEIFKEQSFVETVDNQIYFYSGVEASSILQLNRRVRELDHQLLVNGALQQRPPASIFLHVASYGGSLLHGLAGMDAIIQTKVPVISIVDGCCASAATFLTVVAKRRQIGRYSFMLIHQLSALTWGKYRELQDDKINFDRFMKTIKDVDPKYTKVPVGKLDEILDHDLWFDAEQCLEYGLVDEII